MIVNTFAGNLDICMFDMYIRNHTIRGDLFEQHIILGPLKTIIQKSKVILDIGANNGNHTLAYSFLSQPECSIYAFEPQKFVFNHLENTVKLNDHTREKVKLFNKAVGDTCRTDTMCTVDITTPQNLGGVSIGTGGEEVEMITIDSLNIKSCDFVKMDVEGYESHVILGAKDTISKFKPIIMFEHNRQSEHDTPFKMLSEIHGYTNFKYLDWSNWLAWHDDNPPDLPIHPCLPTIYH